MVPLYVFLIYIGSFFIIGIAVSLYSECLYQRVRNSSMNVRGCDLFRHWLDHLSDHAGYCFSFTLHVLDEGTSIAWLLSMYYICRDRNGSDLSQWPFLSRQPTPELLFLVSFIMWSLYKVGSLIYMVFGDIFPAFQIGLHLFDANYLYEMHIAHYGDNQNKVIPWMHRQYIYFCALPLWFLQFTFMMRWSELFPSHSAAIFIILLLSLLFGFIDIYHIILWLDLRAFKNRMDDEGGRGFRVLFCFRGEQFVSRMVWLSYFWIFVGSAPFSILIGIMLLNHCYLYIRGYLTESFHVITKLFVLPDFSVGVHRDDYMELDPITRVLYAFTHCAVCVVGVADDPLAIDLLQWLHWFEDLVLWAVITGICNEQPNVSENSLLVPSELWTVIWSKPRFEAFYALGIIFWFFSVGLFWTLRHDDFIDRTQKPMALTQSFLGLAKGGQWNAVQRLLDRMRGSGINRRNMMDSNKTALHYAIEQNRFDVVEKLLSLGADPHITDRQHRSGVYMMMTNDKIKDLHLFGKFLDSLHDANGNGDVLQKDNEGRTLLHVICRNDTVSLPLKERLEAFLTRFESFDVNIRDKKGLCPMHYIVKHSVDIPARAYLVEKGGDINAEDDEKQTLLCHAVKCHQNGPTIQWLLDHDADINHQDANGQTPLHHAVKGNVMDNVEILVERFPNIAIRDNDGQNAYNLAVSMHHTSCANYLEGNMPPEELISTPKATTTSDHEPMNKVRSDSDDQRNEIGGNPLLSDSELDRDGLTVEESLEMTNEREVTPVMLLTVESAGDAEREEAKEENGTNKQLLRPNDSPLLEVSESPSSNDPLKGSQEASPNESVNLKVERDSRQSGAGYLAIDNSRSTMEESKETTKSEEDGDDELNEGNAGE